MSLMLVGLHALIIIKSSANKLALIIKLMHYCFIHVKNILMYDMLL